MSFFGRVEEACAAFIERAFANMFPSDLEPAQIAQKLVATMEARTHRTDGGSFAPERYLVYIHSSDFARLSPHRSYLEQEWAALLVDMAERVGIAFQAPPHVELLEDSNMPAGAVDVVTGAERVSGEHPTAYVLRVRQGIAKQAEFRITGAARVGRNPESDVHLPDPSVSRNHALLDVQDGTLFVADGGSTNGTYVNGERIESREVAVGDRIAFGKAELEVMAP